MATRKTATMVKRKDARKHGRCLCYHRGGPTSRATRIAWLLISRPPVHSLPLSSSSAKNPTWTSYRLLLYLLLSSIDADAMRPSLALASLPRAAITLPCSRCPLLLSMLAGRFPPPPPPFPAAWPLPSVEQRRMRPAASPRATRRCRSGPLFLSLSVGQIWGGGGRGSGLAVAMCRNSGQGMQRRRRWVAKGFWRRHHL